MTVKRDTEKEKQKMWNGYRSEIASLIAFVDLFDAKERKIKKAAEKLLKKINKKKEV